ncbi:unnamed protein product, partial [Linum tenue]
SGLLATGGDKLFCHSWPLWSLVEEFVPSSGKSLD